jgi:hypothetical protein
LLQLLRHALSLYLSPDGPAQEGQSQMNSNSTAAMVAGMHAGISTVIKLAENEASDAFNRSLLASYGENVAFTAAVDSIILNAKHVAEAEGRTGFPTIPAIQDIREAFGVGLLPAKRLWEESDRRNGWTDLYGR